MNFPGIRQLGHDYSGRFTAGQGPVYLVSLYSEFQTTLEPGIFGAVLGEVRELYQRSQYPTPLPPVEAPPLATAKEQHNREAAETRSYADALIDYGTRYARMPSHEDEIQCIQSKHYYLAGQGSDATFPRALMIYSIRSPGEVTPEPIEDPYVCTPHKRHKPNGAAQPQSTTETTKSENLMMDSL